MTPPTIRDEVLDAWRGVLRRAGARADTVDALVLELEQAAAGHGARLPMRPRLEDPNAVALNLPPATAVRRAADSPDAQAARAAIRPTAAVDTRRDRPTTDHLPPVPTPEDPSCPTP